MAAGGTAGTEGLTQGRLEFELYFSHYLSVAVIFLAHWAFSRLAGLPFNFHELFSHRGESGFDRRK